MLAVGFFMVALGLFLVSPVLVGLLSLVPMVVDHRNIAGWGLFFAAAAAVFMSQVTPTPDMDLYRYQLLMAEYEGSPMADVLGIIWGGSDPMSYTLMYLVSGALGPRAIPAASAMLGYSVLFYVLGRVIQKTDASRTVALAAVVVFLCSHHLINVFTGFRFGLGVTLFVAGVVLQEVDGRVAGSVVLLLGSVLFHSSMLLLLLIYALIVLTQRLPLGVRLAAVGLFGGLTSLMVDFARQIGAFSWFVSYAQSAEFYLSGYSPGGDWFLFQVSTGVLMVLASWVCLRAVGRDGCGALTSALMGAVAMAGLLMITNFHIATRLFTVSRLLFVIALLCALARPLRVGDRVVLLGIAAVTALGMVWNQFSALVAIGGLGALYSSFSFGAFR